LSKISSTKKVILEDLPAEVRPWMKKLIDPLNRFLEQTYYALVQGLTTADNLKAQVNTITVAANTTYPIEYAWKLNERPTAVWVANISDTTGALVPAFSTSWTYDNGQVKVTLNGLTAANKYTLKLIGLV
jgi:hypothetical protein